MSQTAKAGAAKRATKGSAGRTPRASLEQDSPEFPFVPLLEDINLHSSESEAQLVRGATLLATMDVFDARGFVQVSKLVSALKTTAIDLASTTGLPKEAVSKTARQHSDKTQMRLREVTEIVNRVTAWAGSVPGAYAWFRSQPIPAFGDRTAESLVKEGHAEAVRKFLDHVAQGGFA